MNSQSRFFIFICALSLFLSAAYAEDPVPKNLPENIKHKVNEVAFQLKQVKECKFLLQYYHPTDPSITQLGFCFYNQEAALGMFKAVGCLGVMVVPETGTKHEYYGSSGHWGVEQECHKDTILKSLEKSKDQKINNPLTAFRMKRKEGIVFRLLRDELGLWPAFKKLVEQ